MEEARLDVAYTDTQGRRAYVDVSVTDAATVDQERLRRRARHDGAAALSQEDVKRLRYPGADLVPFVLEALGRPGESAVALLRSVAPLEKELRGPVVGAAWQTLSALLQEELAEALLTASVEGFQGG